MPDSGPSSLLRATVRLHVQAQRRALACNGASLTQCTILTHLDRADPLTLGELSARVGLEKSWTSRAVDRLAREGLLRKGTGTHDRRTVRITITPKGVQHRERINELLDGQAERVMADIPAAQRGTVVQAMQWLHDAYQRELASDSVLPSSA
jgi:DNA-binding MarR family transcriptional regulator